MYDGIVYSGGVNGIANAFLVVVENAYFPTMGELDC
jgi:hypothetical protein